MFGLGVLKGLGITLKHFISTYVDDIRYVYFPSSATSEQAFARRQGPEGEGLFTVEYPEMKLATPENFRFLPFLVTDYTVPKDSPDFDRAEWLKLNRCTSCGICAKVCPPQCIWIVRTDDPETGKPIPQPAEFYIDTDICMNCGYCAEFCPFDAIKMDHDYELADYEREHGHVHDLERLLQPLTYYASIRPNWNAREEAARRAAEEERKRKALEKGVVPPARQKEAVEAKAAPPQPAPAAAAPAEAAPQPASSGPAAIDEAQSTAEVRRKRSPEEIKAQRDAMMAKRQQREGKTEAAETKVAEAVEQATAIQEGEGVKPDEVAGETGQEQRKRSPEEIKAQREAMLARRKNREQGGGQ
jgi:NADH-quinone oxidoreductase subunit I